VQLNAAKGFQKIEYYIILHINIYINNNIYLLLHMPDSAYGSHTANSACLPITSRLSNSSKKQKGNMPRVFL